MKTAEIVISKFAHDIAEVITKKVISELEEIKESLSGDDTELENAWEEICVQIQLEDSHYWDAYESTIYTIIKPLAEKLKEHHKVALWFETKTGEDWLYDQEDGLWKEDPPVEDNEVIEHLTNELYGKAINWESENIRSYLDRFIS